MRLIQGLFLFYIILTINILNAEGDLKFDAQGNIIDDGLNLNIPSLPKDLKDQKKSKPLGSAKSNRLLPKSDRVMADSAAKGTGNVKASASKDPTLDELLKMAGLDSKGQKLETVKADKVAQNEEPSNALSNLNQEQLKTLLQKVGQQDNTKKQEVAAPVAEEAKDAKVSQGLGQMLGARALKKEDSSAQIVVAGVSKKEAEPGLRMLQATEPSVNGFRQLNNQESPVETPVEGEQSMELYPWQSEICKDYDEAACAAFKPMCSIMGVIAHKKCRKTCKLCLQDKTSPRTLKAKLKEFSLTLTQNGPLAPSFLTVCIDKSAAQQYGLPDDAMSLIIHAYGDANEDTCENFGPHFNPYGVPHGHPEDVTKHVGDLGILEFRQVPAEWPEDVIRCKANQIGSYGVFDHINLYGENSPCYRPVVLYKGEAPMKEFKSSLALACDVLEEHDGNTNTQKYEPEPENATPIVAVSDLLNASRVKETQDLLEAVKVKEAADAGATGAARALETATKLPLASIGTDVDEEDATEKSATKGAKLRKLDGSAKPRNLEGSATTVASVVAETSAHPPSVIPTEDEADKAAEEEEEDL